MFVNLVKKDTSLIQINNFVWIVLKLKDVKFVQEIMLVEFVQLDISY